MKLIITSPFGLPMDERRDHTSDRPQRKFATDPDAGTEFCLACSAGGAGLGYVQSRYRYSAWTSALTAEFEDVFVIAEVRRQGVGRQLVEFAIARAIARGCRTVGLTTNERNVQALALYRTCGFIAERSLWKGGRQLWLEKPLG